MLPCACCRGRRSGSLLVRLYELGRVDPPDVRRPARRRLAAVRDRVLDPRAAHAAGVRADLGMVLDRARILPRDGGALLLPHLSARTRARLGALAGERRRPRRRLPARRLPAGRSRGVRGRAAPRTPAVAPFRAGRRCRDGAPVPLGAVARPGGRVRPRRNPGAPARRRPADRPDLPVARPGDPLDGSAARAGGGPARLRAARLLRRGRHHHHADDGRTAAAPAHDRFRRDRPADRRGLRDGPRHAGGDDGGRHPGIGADRAHGLSRPAHRPAEPRPVLRPPAPRARAGGPASGERGHRVVRPRPFQGAERRAGPRAGRPAPPRGRPPPDRDPARGRHHRPRVGRRVRGPRPRGAGAGRVHRGRQGAARAA